MIPRHSTLLALALICAIAAPLTLTAQINGLPAQSGAAENAMPAPQPQAVQVEIQKPSSLIAPAVDHLSQVVSQVALERWKSSSRDEADGNLRSIERNLQSTLPDLVTAADAQPTSVAASLPVLRNLDALCAVMIRVSVAARTNAPAQEAESLTGALAALQSARNTLSDQVQTLATAEEKQITALRNTVATLTASAGTPSGTPPPATSAKTAPKRKKKVVSAKQGQPAAASAGQPKP